ncbi:MAG: hypothetical protein RIM84_00325 [Alphaproteobacteria bacterium]
MDDSKRKDEGERPADEAKDRFEKAVERMVNTPPKPHKPKPDSKDKD